MSIYYEIPQLEYRKVVEDIRAGKVPVKMEFCDWKGNICENGEPRVFDGENYVWLYEGVVYKGCLGVKVFGRNDPGKFFEILRKCYGKITPIHEEDLGILHIG